MDFTELHSALDELREEDFNEQEMSSKLHSLEEQLDKLTLWKLLFIWIQIPSGL